MNDEKLLNGAIKNATEHLKNAKLTPIGIEKRKCDIKKWLKISVGCLVVAVFLFLLLLETKVHDSFYSLGKLAAIFLGCIDLICFIFGICGLFLIWQDWRLIRRSEKQSDQLCD